jgi:hypothetical protein
MTDREQRSIYSSVPTIDQATNNLQSSPVPDCQGRSEQVSSISHSYIYQVN